ncbi:hypothetical protein [Pararhodobacter sp. CCB-MM2]|uniref:hypothetical protein n=1 Tax=Pararhodobacter sp. CCB-MM2 TaxID=1786003 RepID=UPI00082AE47D|nr:hypothetical protein [Pararhodobacter sp. CCB-MM2]
MPRNLSGVYNLPAGYEASDGTLATAAQHNDPLEDLQADANTARPISAGGTGATTEAGARTNLLTASLNALAGVTPAADRMPFFNGASSADLATITSFGRTLIALADAAAAKTELGLGTMADEAAADYLALAGGTLTGPLKTLEAQETVSALSGTTPSVDLEAATVFTLTTSGNTTFTFDNPAATGTGSAFTLIVTAGGTHTLTWPASVDWAGGTAPDAPASGETDAYVFVTVDGGTTWLGFLSGDAMA